MNTWPKLVHAADKPDILNVSTLAVIDNAARLGVLAHSDAEVLRGAGRLYHDLTQIIRLCVTGKFNPAASGEDLLRVKSGVYTFDEIKRRALGLDEEFQREFERTTLPDQPDVETVDAFLIEARRTMV